MTYLQPHRPTLFIDRNSGGRTFKNLLVQADIQVVLHDERFKPDTPDEVWVKEIGVLGWIGITCDVRTTRSPLFLAALKRSRARVFILDALNGASREAKAKCIIDAYDKRKVISEREPPLFWRINREGQATCINFRHTLGMLRRHGKNE